MSETSDWFEPSDEQIRRLQRLQEWVKSDPDDAYWWRPEFWEATDRAYESIFRLRNTTEKRRSVVTAIESLIDVWPTYAPVVKMEDGPDAWRDRIAWLAARLVEIDERFRRLPPERIRLLLEQSAKDGKGGAGRRRAKGIAAILSVECNAFDDKEDGDEKAITKSTEAYRKSVTPA